MGTIKKINKRFSDWFGYYRGPLSVHAGRNFKEGTGFDVSIRVFQIRRLGIRIVTDVQVNADPAWFSHLKERIEPDEKA